MSLLTILFLSTTVSAFWSFNFTFSGNAIKEQLSSANKKVCTDSDNGISFFNAGVVTYKHKTFFGFGRWKVETYKDSCYGNLQQYQDGKFYKKLKEYSCDKGQMVKKTVTDCENGCKNGACINKSIVTPPVSCDKNNFTMAFLLIAHNSSEVSQSQIDKLNSIKKYFSDDFANATRYLASIDTSYPVVVIIDNGSLIGHEDYDIDWIYPERVMNKFYESNPDKFDFVSFYPVFNDFNTKEGIESHLNVQHNILGLGSEIADDSKKYGSNGKLLGINFFPNIERITSPETDMFRSGGLLHETGHQWCCYAGDDFAKGENGAKLEIIQQGIHFYRGLQSPYPTGDPMGSDNWVINPDGTYRRENAEGIQKYHPIQLYFMGLLPKEEYSQKYKIYNAGIVGVDFNDQKAVFYKEVSILDIIAVEGQRKCAQNDTVTPPENPDNNIPVPPALPN
ncbi:MAG: hypothetical protein Q7S74_03010 [Nanoarchaeota archaeon]|nr:hypothetical protein [Nanoarchaeota archaeon]